MNKKHQEFFEELNNLLDRYRASFLIRRINGINQDSLEILIGRRERGYIINDFKDLEKLSQGVDDNA